MKIGVRNPAPLGPDLKKWGDYQFGRSLEASLKRLNVEVEQRFWPEWDKLGDVDLCLTLRGKRSALPHPGALNAIWVISHPAAVSSQELEAYDLVFSASDTHCAWLADQTKVPVQVLRQCTDTTIFMNGRSVEEEATTRRSALFVANSRGVRRPVLAAMRREGVPVSIVGRHWRAVGLQHLVRQEFVENDLLPDAYRNCRLALNDHWCDMKYFGMINNRIFDCLACGTPVLTDRFPELEEVCGDAVLYFEGPDAFRESMLEFYFNYENLLYRTRELWARIGEDYSFDRRARQIVEAASALKPWRSSTPADLVQADVGGLDARFDELKARLGVALLRVLHVSPQPPVQHALAGRVDIDYITAGRGVGPWLVDLGWLVDGSGGKDILPASHFHIILLNEPDGRDTELLWPLLAKSGIVMRIGLQPGDGAPGKIDIQELEPLV